MSSTPPGMISLVLGAMGDPVYRVITHGIHFFRGPAHYVPGLYRGAASIVDGVSNYGAGSVPSSEISDASYAVVAPSSLDTEAVVVDEHFSESEEWCDISPDTNPVEVALPPDDDGRVDDRKRRSRRQRRKGGR